MNIWKIIFQRSQTLSVAFNGNCAGGKRMPDTYDYITLMCRLKAAQARNKELESGERYIKLKETGTYAAGNPSSTAGRSS